MHLPRIKENTPQFTYIPTLFHHFPPISVQGTSESTEGPQKQLMAEATVEVAEELMLGTSDVLLGTFRVEALDRRSSVPIENEAAPTVEDQVAPTMMVSSSVGAFISAPSMEELTPTFTEKKLPAGSTMSDNPSPLDGNISTSTVKERFSVFKDDEALSIEIVQAEGERYVPVVEKYDEPAFVVHQFAAVSVTEASLKSTNCMIR